MVDASKGVQEPDQGSELQSPISQPPRATKPDI